MFLMVCGALVFFGDVCLVFVLWLGASLRKLTLGKVLFMSGLLFWVRSLFFLVFFVNVVFVFRFPFLSRDTDQVVTGHPYTCTILVCSFFLSSRIWFIAQSGRAPFLLAFFGFSWNSRGLSSLAPSETFFGCEAARMFLLFSFVVFVFPFCCVCGHTFLVAREGSLTEVGYGRPFFGIVCCFFLFARGSQGPSDALEGRGAYCPLASFSGDFPSFFQSSVRFSIFAEGFLWIADQRLWGGSFAP